MPPKAKKPKTKKSNTKKSNTKKSKPKESKQMNIASSSLLPAREPGEKPSIPFNIKSEKSEPFKDPNIKEIFSMVESSKRNTVVPGDADISNHSNTSTATAPMENGEGTVNNLDADLAENQVVPTSFEQVLKQEPIEPDVAGNEDSRVEEFMPNNLVENSANEVFPVVKKEPFEERETCQELSDQEMTNAALNIKAEPSENVKQLCDNSENASELQNGCHEKTKTKRKQDEKKFEEAFQTIRKRMKMEPTESDLPVNSNQVTKDDDGSFGDIEAEEIIDHDIAVVPAPKVQKNIDVVTISDDEEEDQNSESQNVSTMNLPKTPRKERNFSIDILKFFNVVSDLDRYDCQASLDHLSKYKTKNALQNFFPVVKKEEISKRKIQKGDILFKRIVTETDSDRERPCSSENVDSNFLNNKLPVQPAAESASHYVNFPVQHATVSQYDNFPVQQAAVSQYINFPAQHAVASQYVNFPVPSASQSTMISPNLSIAPVSSNFGPQNPQIAVAAPNFGPQNPQIAVAAPNFGPQNPQIVVSAPNFGPQNPQIAVAGPNLSTEESGLPVSVPDLQKILEYIQMSNPGQNLPLQDFVHPKDPKKHINIHDLHQNSPILDKHQNIPVHIAQQNMSLDPHKNIPLKGVHQNSPILDKHQNIPVHITQQNMSLDPHKNIPLKGVHQNPLILDQYHNIPVHNPQQNMSLEPHKIVPLKHQNSPIHEQLENLQLHDPRLRKKARLENGSTIQVLTSQPAAPLPNQRFPGAATSSYPIRVSSASSSANKVTFPNRKGAKDLLLYHNIGRDDITQHFETLILQWNPSWMEIQKKTGSWPPICNSYPTVGYFYRNEMDYYNTYVPLHLLHIWYNMYECWEKKTFTVIERCKIQSVEKSDNGFKISCSVELNYTQVWPKRDDIIWCKHNGEEAFLLVEDVKKRPTTLSISKLKISLHSLHDLNLKLDDELDFYILWNIRTGWLQTEALSSLESSMKEVVLKPEAYSSCIGIVQLDLNKHIKEQRDAVFKILKLDDMRVIVIETYHGFTSILLLTHLAFNIVYEAAKYDLIPKNEKKQLKVLIIMKCNDLFTRLYKSLSTYNPVLAVRTKQIKLDPELIKHTLEDRLDRKESLNDILTNHHIFMTTFSAFGSAEKTHLSKLKNLICVIDDAHLCTEVETALPLTLKIKKLLLIGDRQKPFPMPDILRSQNYHVSLFVRLLKARRHL